MPAGRQHEAQILAAEQPRTAVAGLPRRDVVGDPGDDVGIRGQLRKRSTGVPSMLTAPGVASELCTPIISMSR